MKRKELEKLTILQATTAMLKQAENEPMIESGYFRKELRYEHEYYARCKRFDRILKVAIYLTKNLAAGGTPVGAKLCTAYKACVASSTELPMKEANKSSGSSRYPRWSRLSMMYSHHAA